MGLIQDVNTNGFVQTTIGELIKWGQKNSPWPNGLGTSCCAIEMMSWASSRYDSARYGAEVFRMTPRQSDILLVAGTVTYKMGLVVRRLYDQMLDPKWVIAMGACASSGGIFRTYSVVQGIDKFLPVDFYIPGCPPRPEQIFVAWLAWKEKLDKTHHPDLINFGQNVSAEPTGDKYDSDICFDPLNPHHLDWKSRKKPFYGD
ncbi:MAG: NADH-quinone oxidoreductase subunit NuoB [Ignavibacteria bacterium]|jgi:NADH-quinone oxidoreductase subunit B|nr:NADH-quinone oxidoreductase subunit NuoB [Ignavibacteria bacterium]